MRQRPSSADGRHRGPPKPRHQQGVHLGSEEQDPTRSRRTHPVQGSVRQAPVDGPDADPKAVGDLALG